MTGPVDLPPPAGVGGELGGAPDTGADAGAQLRVLGEISSTIDSTVVPAKLFWAVSGRQPDRSTGVPLATAALTIDSRERST